MLLVPGYLFFFIYIKKITKISILVIVYGVFYFKGDCFRILFPDEVENKCKMIFKKLRY